MQMPNYIPMGCMEQSRLPVRPSFLPTRPARWGEAGRRKVIGRTWGRLCDELLGHYDEVIAARRGAVTSLDIKTK